MIILFLRPDDQLLSTVYLWAPYIYGKDFYMNKVMSKHTIDLTGPTGHRQKGRGNTGNGKAERQ